jgi:hypothetical protein
MFEWRRTQDERAVDPTDPHVHARVVSAGNRPRSRRR